MANLREVGKEYSDKIKNIDEYIKILEAMFYYADEPTTVQILAGFNESDLFKVGLDKNITDLLGNGFLKSITYLNDDEIKKKIYKNFEVIHDK